MSVGGGISARPFVCTAVPFSIPAEPIAVRLGSPLDQDWRTEVLRFTGPSAKINIELAGEDFLKRENLVAMLLIDIGAQHQTHVRNLSCLADPTEIG